jgi:dienelactone hydrolase
MTLWELIIGDAGEPPIAADLRSRRPEETLPLIIVCHGFLGYKRWGFFPYISEELAGAGFHVLTMSFSHCGVDEETGCITRPEAFASNTVSRQISDLERVYAHARGGLLPLRVEKSGWGLLGHSRGGAVAILTAGAFDEIRSMVTWATPSRFSRYSERRKKLWKRDGAITFMNERSPVPLRLDYSYLRDIEENVERFDILRHAASLAIPHLMIHGENDAAVTLGEVRDLVDAPRGYPGRFEIVKGCGHTFGTRHPMKRRSAALEKAVRMTAEWFTKTLGGPR